MNNQLQARVARVNECRHAFTMVELLIVMAVFCILLSIMAAALLTAQEKARAARTRAIIAKLNLLVMAKWETFKTRRVPVPAPAVLKNSEVEMARARLDGLRELMRIEMPDRFTDITDEPVMPDPARIPASDQYNLWMDAVKKTTNPRMQRTGISQAYKARYDKNTVNGVLKTPTALYQNAECLYLLVQLGLEEGANSEYFSADESGDTDNDGLPEFLDGWGKPIYFLRWPVGFESDLHDRYDPDPFDPLWVWNSKDTTFNPPRPKNFAVFPLIYSPGSDGVYGIVGGSGVAGSPTRYSKTNDPNGPFNDPYFKFTTSDYMGAQKRQTPKTVATDTGGTITVHDANVDLGETGSGDYSDNIHNHDTDVRLR